MPDNGEITVLLQRWRGGDRDAFNQLTPVIYPRLHAIAGGLAHRDQGRTGAEATVLVHEAYMRLLNQRSVQWEDREHFYSFAAQLMRMILTDNARARLAAKRGSGAQRTPLHESVAWISSDNEEMLDLNAALDELAALDPRKVKIVELRYVLGCTAEETADVLNLSKATVDRDLQVARAWLFRRLKGTSQKKDL